MEARHQYQGVSLLGSFLCTCGAKALARERIDSHIKYYADLERNTIPVRPLGQTPGFAPGGVVGVSEKDRELFKALMGVQPGEKVTKKAEVKAAVENRMADAVDMVNHPSHYTRKIEVLDFVEAYGLHHFAYLKDAVKYIARHQFKGSPLEDLKKARFYLDRHIKNLEAEGDPE